jgi:hypothetical protein
MSDEDTNLLFESTFGVTASAIRELLTNYYVQHKEKYDQHDVICMCMYVDM